MHSGIQMASSGDVDRISPLEDDLVAHQFITNKQTLAFETELFGTKWFDYRHMTPLAATRLYIQAFADAYKGFYAEYYDSRAAPHVQPPDVDSIFAKLVDAKHPKHVQGKSHLKAAWHGRQCADLIGLPYNVYIDQAMTFRLRYWQQRNVPQMQHLYTDWIIDCVNDKWTELQEAILYLSDHPAYMVQNYCGTQAQNDYHEWLFRQAELRANPPEFYARFINDDLISYQKVEARTASDVFERVHQYLN